MTGIDEATTTIPSKSEKSDSYPVVAHLNDGWRVIVCGAGIQWILQRRGSPKKPRRDDWRGRSYCRTSEALIRCAREYAGSIDPAAAAILAALPEWIEHPNREVIPSNNPSISEGN
jgi:hypothetical protein